MYRLLDGIRVLELGGDLAVSYATKLLAQYGADVLKVEKPGHGDASAGEQIDRGSAFSAYVDANKRSITLDVQHDRGRRLFLRLAVDADALVEGMPPVSLSDRGLSHADLYAVNPQLVITSVSGFGRAGPYADYKATDLVAWAASGALSSTGLIGREPLLLGNGLSYYAAGALAASATLAQLIGEEAGSSADVSLLDGMVQLMGSWVVNAGHFDPDAQRLVTRDPLSRPIACSDGYVGINPLSPQHWPMFCAMIGDVGLAGDPRFETMERRGENAVALKAIIQPWFTARSRDEVFQLAGEFNLPAAYVATAPEMLALEQHAARGYWTELALDESATVKVPGPPVKFPAAPSFEDERGPRPGQDNEAVYGALGIDAKERQALRLEGVI